MRSRLLQLDDVRQIETPEKIAALFAKLGYNALAQPLPIDDLELPAKSAEAIWNAYLIANQGRGALQVLLFHLQDEHFSSPAVASNRMRSIAQSLCKRSSEFLLLGTKDYNQLMLVNPRKSFDAQMNLKVGIRKLLIDRTNPTNYDRDRLEAIAARGLEPQELYKAQCEAFDVEKLTKEFYRNYREIFEYVQLVIKDNNPHSYFDDKSRLHQFSQRLLGRIMFLYFLQKKGFLAGDYNFLKNQYPRQSEPEDTDFYTGVLEPLFFETLNKQRLNHDSQWGKIPYLNGGLFDKDYGIGLIDSTGVTTASKIQLPNSLFDPSGEKGILKFFNGYNFTVDENVQGDEEVAVDPEMLGKVFENLLASEERGQSGTFYTPRGIVHFMCVESLSRYLADSTGMSPDAIKQLIELDPDITDAELKLLLTREQARKLKQAIAEVKCLDPAVGSAAFPLGMMQVILAVRQAIARREGMTVERGSLTISQWKRDIIENNLYGVDIKPEAIEIAKLRMWLSLVVDIPAIDDVEPLPNLDYKLMCGDSLISTINGEQLIPDPAQDEQQLELNVTPIQAAIQPLLKLQQQYYSAQSEERKALRQQIIEAEKNVFRVATADRYQFWESKQRNLGQDVQRMGRVSSAQVKRQQVIADKLAQIRKFATEVESGKRSLNFFQYHLHFNDLFQKKGGFDIVIGNPPYVRQERLAEEYKESLKAEFPDLFNGTADIYTYFYGRGVNLLRLGGNLAFISSNKWFRANYGSNLRKHLAENCHVYSITDFGELPVFDAATFPMIFIAQKGKLSNEPTLFTKIKSLEPPYPNVAAIVHQQSTTLPLNAINGINWALTENTVTDRLHKMELASVPLIEYVNNKLYVGIKTGFNRAFWIDGVKRAELIAQDPNSEEIIKPLAVGKNVRKWELDYQDKWIIVTNVGVKIERYPAVFAYLKQWESKLKNRSDQGNNWWELRPCAYYSAFEQPKLIFPDIAKESRFTLDTKGMYVDMTAFVIPTDDLYLLGVLNSSHVWSYLCQTASVLGDAERGGRVRLKRTYVKKIPIPKSSKANRAEIACLVQKCLNGKRQDIADWEVEIDERVGHLYGLTAQEMKTIKGD